MEFAGEIILVNSRIVPSWSAIQRLRQWMGTGKTGVVRRGDQVAAAILTGEVPCLPPQPDDSGMGQFLDRVASLPPVELDLPLLEYPHDVIRFNVEILNENLSQHLRDGSYREVSDGVFAAPGAQLGDYCTADTQSGPVVLDENASIGPFSYLKGPAFIGRGAKLIEHSAVKDAVTIAHTAKVGGEVEASVIEPFTNKQHHGFLGHSYLGSWINLGAGTCNSDLKNTYGKVNLEYGDERVATGMQFVGCIMGDYSKSAINTGIFTGKVVGVCSMLYGFVTTNVPSFVNYARLFGEISELPLEVMIATQERMFRRRGVLQRPCDIQLIRDMYELTRDERQVVSEPLAL
jgi:glucose-1-phosphate thymidylyltransferase